MTLQQRIRELKLKHERELAPLRRELADLRRQDKARRAAKPAVARKGRTPEQRAIEREYAEFALNETHCWACGRTRWDKPDWWHLPLLLERCHIVSKPRVEDCRACVVLCSLCHRISHGDTFTYCELPPLTKAHLLWIKREHGGYDPAFLARHNVGALPEPVELPVEYLKSQRKFGART